MVPIMRWPNRSRRSPPDAGGEAVRDETIMSGDLDIDDVLERFDLLTTA
jgi:hypothetical protein